MLQKLFYYDFKLLEYIHLHRLKGADAFFEYLTNHATIINISIILLIFVAYFISKRRHFLYIAGNLSAILIITALVNTSLKLIIQRERPYLVFDSIKKMVDGGSYSFPSGHSAEVFSLMVGIFLLIKNPYLKILAAIWAIFIGYTRMAMGVHYPLDVLGGATLGASLAYFWVKKINFLKKHES